MNLETSGDSPPSVTPSTSSASATDASPSSSGTSSFRNIGRSVFHNALPRFGRGLLRRPLRLWPLDSMVTPFHPVGQTDWNTHPSSTFPSSATENTLNHTSASESVSSGGLSLSAAPTNPNSGEPNTTGDTRGDYLTRDRPQNTETDESSVQPMGMTDVSENSTLPPKANPHFTSASTLSKECISKAEALKDNGNTEFHKGDYKKAIRFYTDAIALNPFNAHYYSNRANAYRQLNEWEKVVDGARQALQIDDESVKGHYLLGLGLVYSGDGNAGLEKLSKAKSLASSQKGYVMEQNIEDAILLAKRWIWEQGSIEKKVECRDLLDFFAKQLEVLKELGKISAEEKVRRLNQLNAILKVVEERNEPFEIPNHLCCRISTCLMRDPVCTKSGMTYERRFLLQHFDRNGYRDPVTRDICQLSDIIPNFAIREGVQYFLDKYPWAADAL